MLGNGYCTIPFGTGLTLRGETMSEKRPSIIDDGWLLELHERWKRAGRVASPEDVGGLLKATAQEWLAEDEDRQLVTAAKEGDDRAWARLIEKHPPRTLRDYLAICRWAEEQELSLARTQNGETIIEAGGDSRDQPDASVSTTRVAVRSRTQRSRPKP
jgi:hypothetical protein